MWLAEIFVSRGFCQEEHGWLAKIKLWVFPTRSIPMNEDIVQTYRRLQIPHEVEVFPVFLDGCNKLCIFFRGCFEIWNKKRVKPSRYDGDGYHFSFGGSCSANQISFSYLRTNKLRGITRKPLPTVTFWYTSPFYFHKKYKACVYVHERRRFSAGGRRHLRRTRWTSGRKRPWWLGRRGRRWSDVPDRWPRCAPPPPPSPVDGVYLYFAVVYFYLFQVFVPFFW